MDKLFISLFLFWINAAIASEPLVIYHRTSDTVIEYHSYYDDLVKLALEKTKPEFGNYKMIAVPAELNTLRALSDISRNIYGNMVMELSYETELTKSSNLTFINIPLDGGIVGYRICFVSPAKKDAVANAKNLQELQQFTIAQGVGWADTQILKANGFNVIEIPIYTNIFKMITSNRVDLFCRGANQIKSEMEYFKNIKGLDFDRSFVLVYDLPRFFYIHKDNIIAKNRIEKGLQIASEDGSLRALWEKYNRESIDYAELINRKIYYLDNPLLKGLAPDYKQYFFDPMKKANYDSQ
jgi:hypothetical protein